MLFCLTIILNVYWFYMQNKYSIFAVILVAFSLSFNYIIMARISFLKPILHCALGLSFGKGCKPLTFQNVRTKCKRLTFSPNA